MLKTKKTKIPKRAFSLLELSVVILVIGILITGVMKGGSLVSASRLNAARSLTARAPVGEINGLTAWYETTSLQSFGTRKAGVSGTPPTAATILVAQLTDRNRVEIWRDIGPKCINNYSIANTTTSTPTQATDYINTCNALSQAILVNRPYYSLSGINNLPSVSFEGGQSLLLDAFKDGDIASSTKFVVFSVDAKPTSGTNFILDNNPTSTQQRIALSSTNISVNNGTDTSIASSYNVKNTYILAVISAGGTSYYKINNNSLSTSINPGSNTATGFTVGGITNNFFRGKISEIIVFNRMLQQSEITEIFNYLGKKYKVQVL